MIHAQPKLKIDLARVMARVLLTALALAAGIRATGTAFAEDAPKKGPQQKITAMSNADQAAMAQSIVQRGSDLATRVSHMLDDAGREGDIIRVTCLNDKLTQINANLHTAQSRVTALQTAVNKDERNHETTVLSVLAQKLQTLDQEANQCIGQDLYETGKTKVTTVINPSLLPFGDDAHSPPVMLPPGGAVGTGDIPPPVSPTK